MLVMKLLLLLGSQQIDWILQDSKMSEACHQLRRKVNLWILEDHRDMHDAIILLTFMHLIPNGTNSPILMEIADVYKTDTFDFCIHAIKLTMYCDRKCGNKKCKKDYMVDCYGSANKHYKAKKRIKRWKLCKGCLTTNFCNRKCQKISWKQEHKEQCQRLQKLRQNM